MEIKNNQLPNLKEFTGTVNYNYLTFQRNLKFTDGWAYLADSAGCYWLAEIISSVQSLESIKQNKGFILWKIEVFEDDTANITALTDTNGLLLYEQKLNYTNFPKGTFEWYQCDDVILLKGEY